MGRELTNMELTLLGTSILCFGLFVLGFWV